MCIRDRSLGRTSLVQHRINTGDTTPIRQPPRRPPLSKQEEMSRLVKDMLTEGVIEPSSSAWSSPVVPVSYTHLDVYKRQVLGRLNSLQNEHWKVTM